MPPLARSEQALARELSRLSAREMVSAMGLSQAPWLVREASLLPLHALSRKLGAALAELDFSIDDLGLPAAAAQALTRLGVTHRSVTDRVWCWPITPAPTTRSP